MEDFHTRMLHLRTELIHSMEEAYDSFIGLVSSKYILSLAFMITLVLLYIDSHSLPPLATK